MWWVFTLFSITINAQNTYKSSSVLSSGKWVKFPVENTGVYKITFSELKKMGFSDPSKVSLHGYGGNLLSEDINSSFYDDLPNIPVYKTDTYLIFYAQGVIKWEYQDGRYIHTNNYCANYGYYFITDSQSSNIISSTSFPTNNPDTIFTSFNDYAVYEKEIASPKQSGRKLYGEMLSTANRKFTFTYPEGILQTPGSLECNVVTRSTASQTVRIIENDKQVMSGIATGISTLNGLYSYSSGKETLFTSTNWIPSNIANTKFHVIGSESTNAYSRLDYLRFNFHRKLQNYGKPCMLFRNTSSSSQISQFNISKANDQTIIWDITNPIQPIQIKGQLSGDIYSFTVPIRNYISEFVLIQPEQNLPSINASDVIDVPNQNLHGESDINMVIVTVPGFLEEAKRLQEVHKKVDDINTLVVTQEQIFNEFSSGTPDVTAIRRFMYKLYAENEDFKYLLLLGGGAYDNRFLTTEWQQASQSVKSNIVLTYQTDNSLNHESHVSDDYFGWFSGSSIVSSLGIGRIPANNINQVKNMVDKIITYIQDDNMGQWKTKAAFIADDGGSNDPKPIIHMRQTDDLTKILEKSYTKGIINKIYLDAYKKEKGNTDQYPFVKRDIKRAIEDGVFLVNYVGHGSESAWADEHVFTRQDIQQLTNAKLPIFITASCDFCPFDAASESGGEALVLKKTNGAIALFTTTRVAFTGGNEDFNKGLISNIYSKDLRLGDILRLSKQNVDTTKRLGMALMGDPAIKIRLPQNNIQITKINESDIQEGKSYTFKAMERVHIEGQITTSDGVIFEGFNGTVQGIMSDNMRSFTTLGNLDTSTINTYTDYKNLIFDGATSVTNGKFSFTITIPKDIQYSPSSHGKFNLYAYDETQNRDAAGVFEEYSIYGTSDKPVIDTVLPEIKAIYLNDSSFVDGGKTNSTPYFYARVWDESGINRTGNSVGHDITLTIDGDPRDSFGVSFPYILNNYYTSLLESDNEGEVRFSVPKLTVGTHVAEFKIWDAMNNVRVHRFTFEVVDGLKPKLSHIIAYPSPARSEVTFQLNHNRPQSNLKIQFEVYDLTGRFIWSKQEVFSTIQSATYSTTWDLHTASGSRVRPGIYVYRAVLSSEFSKEVSDANKFIILGQ